MGAALPAFDKPGRYSAVPDDVYHADFAPRPSLSSHVAVTLLERSPRHAWHEHPRLNPNYTPKTAKIFDIGTYAHMLMVRDATKILEILDYPDWRAKGAQARRKDAYAQGRVPLLRHDAERVAEMVHAGHLQLEAAACHAFSDGLPEEAILWKEQTLAGPIWCRARLDWFPRTGAVFYDYKSTGGSAHPDAFHASAWERGYYLQAAFYLRGVRAVTPIAPEEFRFIVQETEPPYALSICAMAAGALAEAEQCVCEAIELWAWCLHNDKWPGYSGRVTYATEPPVWFTRRRELRKQRDERLRTFDGVTDVRQTLIDWPTPL